MIKKLVIGGIVAGALVGLYGVRSYIATFYNQARESVKASIPLELEIERANLLISQAIPEINNFKHLVSVQEADIKELTARIEKDEKYLASKEAELQTLAGYLQKNESQYKFAGKVYTSEEVKADVDSRLNVCKAKKAELNARRSEKASKEKALVAMYAKLRIMDSKVGELRALLPQLKAELEEVKAREAAAAAGSVVEASPGSASLAEAEQLAQDIKKSLNVRNSDMDKQTSSFGEIDVSKPGDAVPETEDAAKRVQEYFKDNPTQPSDDVNPKT